MFHYEIPIIVIADVSNVKCIVRHNVYISTRFEKVLHVFKIYGAGWEIT